MPTRCGQATRAAVKSAQDCGVFVDDRNAKWFRIEAELKT
jgi:hypothetical protein